MVAVKEILNGCLFSLLRYFTYLHHGLKVNLTAGQKNGLPGNGTTAEKLYQKNHSSQERGADQGRAHKNKESYYSLL